MEKSAALAAILIDRLKVQGKPDLRSVAQRLGLEIREVNADGFDGALVRAVGEPYGIIAIKAGISELTRKRFTVAHEIGHFLLPGHDQFSSICSSKTLERWGSRLPPSELDANEFAAELLLPTKYVRVKLVQKFPDFRAIREVAGEYEVSLTATIRKFIRLSDHACAMVWSTRGIVEWYQRSEGFTFYIRTGKLEPNSKASALFRTEPEVSDFVEVDADVWLRPPGDELVDRILEHSIYLRNYNSVLTLLWIENPPESASDMDEFIEELEPTEFTIYRKRWRRK